MIHVIGNAAIDTILHVDRFPKPGETIVARALSEDLGGKGANQAIAIARCGASVRLVAAIGADAAGARIRQALEAESVATHGLTAVEGATDRCVITVDAAGENTIVSVIEAARGFDPAASGWLAGTFKPYDWAVLQGNLTPAATRAALALAKANGAVTAFNPSPTYAPGEYDWSLVDLVVLNQSEAVELGGHEDPFESARALRIRGAEAVALTLGAQGAAILAAEGMMRADAPAVAAVDTVGAGDVFCGALIASRALGRSGTDALRIAVAAASIAVTRRGVLASFPSHAEMKQLLSR